MACQLSKAKLIIKPFIIKEVEQILFLLHTYTLLTTHTHTHTQCTHTHTHAQIHTYTTHMHTHTHAHTHTHTHIHTHRRLTAHTHTLTHCSQYTCLKCATLYPTCCTQVRASLPSPVPCSTSPHSFWASGGQWPLCASAVRWHCPEMTGGTDQSDQSQEHCGSLPG